MTLNQIIFYVFCFFHCLWQPNVGKYRPCSANSNWRLVGGDTFDLSAAWKVDAAHVWELAYWSEVRTCYGLSCCSKLEIALISGIFLIGSFMNVSSKRDCVCLDTLQGNIDRFASSSRGNNSAALWSLALPLCSVFWLPSIKLGYLEKEYVTKKTN